MTYRPGTEIISRDQPVPRSAPTDTGVWFVVGTTGIGPTEPTLITSLTQYEAIFGDRSGGQVLYDAADAYFRSGGAKLYVAASPTTPTLAAVAGGPTYTLDELEGKTRDELNALADEQGLDSSAYSTKADVIDALLGNGVSASPHVLIEADVAALLDAFTADLGPGQVSAPGWAGSTIDPALLDHAAANNRIALIEAIASQTSAQHVTRAATLRSEVNARYGAIFAPYATIPGVAAGTTRSVPTTAIEAGMIARNDALYGPNAPAAGVHGLSSYATDVSDRYTDAEYDELNTGGVDLFRLIFGGVEAYGYRTLVDPAGPEADWLDLGNARLNMAICAQADVIAERYVFSQIDGRGRAIAQFGAELRGMLVPFYEAGELYGSTADEAFYVDVGAQVNTPETIAARELHAVIEVRMSPFAELVVIEIVKVATTQSLAA